MNNLQQYKILVVDDRYENLLALSVVLKKSGYTVDTALSGKQALGMLLKTNYGLIILDVQMPEMNGFELAELIKGNNKTKNIPLIFLSANAIQNHFSNKGLEVGALDYLAKPVDEILLNLKVKNFLQLHDSNTKLELANELLERKIINTTISYENLYYSLSQEVYLINQAGSVIAINRNGVLSCGTTAQALIDQHYLSSPLLQIIAESSELENPFEATDCSLPGIRVEFKFQNNHNSTFHGEAVITSTVINGQPHIQVSVANITDKIKAQEKIVASEKRLRTAQKMAKVGDWWLEIASGNLLWSDEMYVIYNQDPRTFTPSINSLIDLIHPEDKPALKSWIDDLYKSIKQPALLFRLINPDGSIKHILGDGEIIYDSNDKPIRAIGTAQDVSQLIKVEEELKITISELSNRCDELMQFSFHVSHNLRAPVASILGLSELLKIPHSEENDHFKIAGYIHEATLSMDQQIKTLNIILSSRNL